MAGISITVTIDKDVEAELRKIDVFTRAVALDKGLKTIGNKVKAKARRLVQQPGSPGYTKRYGKRKDRKHLRDTMTVKVRDYKDRYKVLLVGPAYPAGAAGHLVEGGHKGGAKPHPFLGPAAAEVEPHAQTILLDELKKAAP